MTGTSDRLHVAYPLGAPPGQVWAAISDAAKFGIWFGAELAGPFAVGASLTGKVAATDSHPGLGRAHQPYLGSTFCISIDRFDPPRRLAFRWQPVTTGAGGSYPAEPVTLVSFQVDKITSGSRLMITDSAASAGRPWADQAVSPVAAASWPCSWKNSSAARGISTALTHQLARRRRRCAVASSGRARAR